jgi:hypothetical protein
MKLQQAFFLPKFKNIGPVFIVDELHILHRRIIDRPTDGARYSNDWLSRRNNEPTEARRLNAS